MWCSRQTIEFAGKQFVGDCMWSFAVSPSLEHAAIIPRQELAIDCMCHWD